MRLCVAAAVFFVAVTAHAQLYSVTSDSGYPLLTIDPASGATNVVLSTGVTVAYGGLSANDVAHHRLFFLTGGIGTQQIVTVDLATHNVTSQPIPNSDPYIFFEYDPVTNRVLAALGTPGTPIVAIDPATGTVSPLIVTSASTAYPGLSALDPATRRLFFLDGGVGSQVLVTVNLSTFTISNQSIPIPDAYVFFEFDPVTNRILSVTSAPGNPLLSIDPATGSVSTMYVTGASGAYPGLSALDFIGRRLFFLTGGVGTQQLMTVALQSGAVSTVSIARPSVYIFFEYPEDISAIPALSLGLAILLALTLAGVAAYSLRLT